ncbi:hypothetical protein VST7929_00036 [Vibrio stylophorae]|uniref:DoxX family protein n=1 Tax=Vibrio stylophorae TaxID=659351 RepID=A0ABM8ZPP7_9VIBR|nr:hypothetical protein [Vibrio stylophorae]CAH0532225.1 hypothetical protein VST7929_00036 [Vibrio stylophorae]
MTHPIRSLIARIAALALLAIVFYQWNSQVAWATTLTRILTFHGEIAISFSPIFWGMIALVPFILLKNTVWIARLLAIAVAGYATYSIGLMNIRVALDFKQYDALIPFILMILLPLPTFFMSKGVAAKKHTA